MPSSHSQSAVAQGLGPRPSAPRLPPCPMFGKGLPQGNLTPEVPWGSTAASPAVAPSWPPVCFSRAFRGGCLQHVFVSTELPGRAPPVSAPVRLCGWGLGATLGALEVGRECLWPGHLQQPCSCFPCPFPNSSHTRHVPPSAHCPCHGTFCATPLRRVNSTLPRISPSLRPCVALTGSTACPKGCSALFQSDTHWKALRVPPPTLTSLGAVAAGGSSGDGQTQLFPRI